MKSRVVSEISKSYGDEIEATKTFARKAFVVVFCSCLLLLLMMAFRDSRIPHDSQSCTDKVAATNIKNRFPDFP